jgi:hypothetical protein
MSRSHISIEELSAYIDGESRRPEAVREHLQACAECARRHTELAKLSSHLRALSTPEVSPAFATRVMATVRETAPSRGRFGWHALLPAGIGLAAAVVLAGLWFAGRPPVTPSDLAQSHPAAVNTDRLMQAIADRIAAGDDPGEFVALAPDDAATTSDDDLAQLAQAEWFGPLADEVEADEDVDAMLSSLNPEQVQVFKQLLVDYAKEG